MVFVYICAALLPLIAYLGLFLFSSIDERLYPRQYPIKQICKSSNCIRCSKNLAVLSRGSNLFEETFNKWTNQRIGKAIENSKNGNEVLLFNIAELRSIPIWDMSELDSQIVEDVNMLENSFSTIKLACLKCLKNASLWMKNQENNGSCWFIFPILNQGIWMEPQCSEDPELMDIIHSLKSTMFGCTFGNIFFSMLPAKTKIDIHRGPTNIRLRYHMGLEVPREKENCYLKVEDKVIHWEEGKSFIFDDSLPHMVESTTTKEDRLAFIVDFWHPDITQSERTILKRLFPETL